MTALGHIVGVYRYPVKSMLGEQPLSVHVDVLGVDDDRTWAVYDHKRGNFYLSKRMPGLMGCSAIGGENGQAPRITLPDGESFSADDPQCGQALSDLLGRTVSVWPIDPDASLPPAEASEEVNSVEYLRAVTARIDDEPLPDLSNFPVSIETFRQMTRRPYSDLAPLMVMTQQSIDAIAAAAPDSKIDVRRFRPSILIDAPDGGTFPEDEWVGGRYKVGGAILRIEAPCPRCIMTTHGFADLPKDPFIMRTLVKEAEGNLGVYASVEQAGTVQTGDVISRVG